MHGRALKSDLVEQVAARVARHGQLGSSQDRGAFRFGPLHEPQNALRVVGTVRNARARHAGSDADEAVLDHCAPALYLNSPATITASARPRTFKPSNGELRLLERKRLTSIVQSARGSMMVTSA